MCTGDANEAKGARDEAFIAAAADSGWKRAADRLAGELMEASWPWSVTMRGVRLVGFRPAE